MLKKKISGLLTPLLGLWLLMLPGICIQRTQGQEPKTYPLWDGHESVAQYARESGLVTDLIFDLGNSVTMRLVLIPAGKFMMGTARPEQPRERVIVWQAVCIMSLCAFLVLALPYVYAFARKKRRLQISLAIFFLLSLTLAIGLMGIVRWQMADVAWRNYGLAYARFELANSDEKPHWVTHTKPFYMGSLTVTQLQYQQIIGDNLSRFNDNDNPVESVSWNDAQDFCRLVSKKIQMPVRLPTEAEWEYACRAGTKGKYYSGDDESSLARVAWYAGNSNSTYPVGTKQPNAFGLFDMHGNVWQWCQDWYAAGYYSKSPEQDPKGPPAGHERIMRGGSWEDYASLCRSAYRYRRHPEYLGTNAGFRIFIPLEELEEITER